MKAVEFFRSITEAQIDRASEQSDLVEDMAAGGRVGGEDYIDRMDFRLRDTYPAVYERIRSYLEQMQAGGESNPAFLMGVFAGATMLGHDLTVTAETVEMQSLLDDPEL